MALLGFAGNAAAAVYTITWTGVVTEVVEDTGGLVGPGAVGDAFTAVFTLDDATAGAFFQTGPGFSDLMGMDGFPSPVAAVFTLDGRAWEVGAQYGVATARDASVIGYDRLETYASTDTDTRHCEWVDEDRICTREQVLREISFLLDSADADFTNGDFRAPLDLALDEAMGRGFFYENYRYAVNGVTQSHRLDLQLRATSLRIAAAAPPSAPVPEPATWAMMILGFGAAGAMVRTRRRVTTGMA
jgi:hypothetical protein